MTTPLQPSDNPIDRLTPEQLEAARLRTIRKRDRMDALNKATIEALRRAGEERLRNEQSK